MISLLSSARCIRQAQRLTSAAQLPQVPRISNPTFDHFRLNYFDQSKPVVITDSIHHWKALSRWKDYTALKSQYGDTIVPVELGRFTDPDFEQIHLRLSQFIDLFILGEVPKKNQGNLPTGYLAQHQLFDSLPALRADFDPPVYTRSGRNDHYQTTVFFGPAGTVSPLHKDPYQNLLAQVTGRKQIRLYPPTQSEFLYPFEDPFKRNTSQVTDIEKYEKRKFPWFEKAEYQECVLGEGEVLFIPLGWWHYVKGLDVSFSVSFWFR
ncbi:Jmjd5 domain of lysine-specific demethylase 8 in complex with N-Oxalylglycine [Endogone sp. FLAS-F59071]|nr:Jmjd5 domain of lysine-specific demethylase 8 in complex with N-Oxalylglycine [Endogone sp. FLAS-F59071]|eukprot:RUS17778.1 Jmjd5 domain of lysine-specific demethylase 8 in complex with N-Oxalylglycine [Endogone sp. FLAS-F59071]